MARCRRLRRVDLRAGGGTACGAALGELRHAGRSPRGRRNRVIRLMAAACRGVDLRAGGGAARSALATAHPSGSISARAEEPWTVPARPLAQRVDLRAGGGALVDRPGAPRIAGRSPRGRRSRASPRSCDVAARVDLRAGGGTVSMLSRRFTVTGRSPRGRRSRVSAAVAIVRSGSISARAEEPLSRRARPSVLEGSISARAEEPSRADAYRRQRQGRSPRGRRSPALPVGTMQLCRVDLRAGGGAIAAAAGRRTLQGRSPRGRRSRDSRLASRSAAGSISARAEEPAG